MEFKHRHYLYVPLIQLIIGLFNALSKAPPNCNRFECKIFCFNSYLFEELTSASSGPQLVYSGHLPNLVAKQEGMQIRYRTSSSSSSALYILSEDA